MKKLVALALATCLCAASFANALDSYLKVRKSSKIVGTSTPQVLDSLVGTKTLEIAGTVKGVVSVGEGVCILLTQTDGSTLYVKSESAPDWLNGNEIAVRMILRASRASETADLKTQLVTVVTESEMASWEAQFAKPASSAKGPAVAKSGGPLSGAITPRGTRLSSRKSTAPRRPANGKQWVVSRDEAIPIYAEFAQKQNSRLSDNEALRIGQGVVDFSRNYNVDARLIMALILAESSFDPRCTSSAGAQGLVQLMPGTARELGVRNAYDAVDNLNGAVKLISKHIDTYTTKTGDDFEGLVLALAAYNAGPGAVSKHGGIPPYRETQNYVRKVIAYYRAICGE